MAISTTSQVISSIVIEDDINFDNLFDDIKSDSLMDTNSIEVTSDDIFHESFHSSSDDIAELLQPFSSIDEIDEPFSSSDVITSTTDNKELDTGKVLNSEIDDTFAPNFDLPIFQSLETNVTDNLNGLSEDLLGNNDLFGNNTNSLGELYNDPIEYGDPFTDGYYWRQQQLDMSCAVVAQISIYESFTGQRISEYDASSYAYQQGWFDYNTGTPLTHVGNILEVLNIDTLQYYNASLNTLQTALARGDKPIVGLDGNEIWNPQRDWYGNPIDQSNAGHAVWVTGIDYEPNGSVNIILNDSGHPNGSSSVVDYYDFMNAWQDYGYFTTIADNPFT